MPAVLTMRSSLDGGLMTWHDGSVGGRVCLVPSGGGWRMEKRRGHWSKCCEIIGYGAWWKAIRQAWIFATMLPFIAGILGVILGQEWPHGAPGG